MASISKLCDLPPNVGLSVFGGTSKMVVFLLYLNTRTFATTPCCSQPAVLLGTRLVQASPAKRLPFIQLAVRHVAHKRSSMVQAPTHRSHSQFAREVKLATGYEL